MILALILLATTVFAFSEPAKDPTDRPVEFPNEFGWTWLTEPIDQGKEGNNALNGLNMVFSDGVAFFNRDSNQRLRVTLVIVTDSDAKGECEYRPVLLDANKNRIETHGISTSQNKKFMVAQFVMEQVAPPKEMRYYGIEALKPEGRKQIAERAIREARDADIQVIPFPEIGRPFDFSFTTMSGSKVSTAGLRDKVILVDLWATWCGPCMEKMPHLKELHDKWHSKGFEIVGINFDDEPGDADKAVAKHGLTWPQVHVPAGENIRRIWNEARGQGSIPQLLLIDRQGVLRFAIWPYELKEKIEAMMSPSEARKP